MHRKSNHPFTVAFCSKFAEGTCHFTADSCWWNHTEKENINKNVQCFICSKTFDSKSEMMCHRKKNHSNIVRQCNLFLERRCRFQNDYCWFKHDIETNNADPETEDVSNGGGEATEKGYEKSQAPVGFKGKEGKNTKLRKNIKLKMKKGRRGRRNRAKNISKSLRLVGVNAAGLKPKLKTFKKVLTDLNPSVFFVQESKYKEEGKLMLDN